MWENFSNVTFDDTRDIAIKITDNLVSMGFVPDNMDSDDEDEFEVQDMIQEEINKFLSIEDPSEDED